MKLFDAHGDIWYDVMMHSEKGERDIFRKYQLPKFQKGNVSGGAFVMWVDPPYDEDPKKRILQIEQAVRQELEDAKDILNIVRKYEDFQKGTEEGKINVVMGLEGLSYIGEDVDRINYYYDEFSVRTMMLTWNEENALASGWPGDQERGLTEAGKAAVRRMNDLGIVLDVSHLNDKGFWDIISLSDRHPVIASHSNARALAPHGRNLSDEMIKALAETGGVLGMNRVGAFISEDCKKHSAEGLADHVEHIVDLVGIDHVGCGFDFEDYVDPGALLKNGVPKVFEAATQGLYSEADAGNFLEVLKKRGYTQEELEKIAYKNFYRVYRQVLK